MKHKYVVEITVKQRALVDVMADSPEEAIACVKTVSNSPGIDVYMHYSDDDISYSINTEPIPDDVYVYPLGEVIKTPYIR